MLRLADALSFTVDIDEDVLKTNEHSVVVLISALHLIMTSMLARKSRLKMCFGLVHEYLRISIDFSVETEGV